MIARLKNYGISSVRDDTNKTNIKEACTSIKVLEFYLSCQDITVII